MANPAAGGRPGSTVSVMHQTRSILIGVKLHSGRCYDARPRARAVLSSGRVPQPCEVAAAREWSADDWRGVAFQDPGKPGATFFSDLNPEAQRTRRRLMSVPRFSLGWTSRLTTALASRI